MSTIDPLLIDAYRHAVYRVQDNDSWIRFFVDSTNPELNNLLRAQLATTGAYITACNPQSMIFSLEENQQFHKKLVAMLGATQFTWLEGDAGDHEGLWEPEKSVLILDISKESATALALEYGQNAFVWIQQDQTTELVLTR